MFGVSIGYLVGKVDEQIDPDTLKQVLTIQKLLEKERSHILFTLEALIRDAKTRLAYAS